MIMSLEFVGTMLPRRESELLPPRGAPVQPAFVAELARAYERSPFDCVQIGQTATSVDAVVLAQTVLAATDRLSVAISLPPRVVEPVAAARAVASLAAMYPGRVHARVPMADEPERRAEFAQIVRALWQAATPLDHRGRYYEVCGHWSVIKPDPMPRLSAHVGVDSRAERATAATADICYVPAYSPAMVAARIGRLRGLIGGRRATFGISIRPIVGEDEIAVAELSDRVIRVAPWQPEDDPHSSSTARARVLAAATRAVGDAAPFVGTTDALASRLDEYVSAGVEVLHLQGFDVLHDVASLGALAEGVRALSTDPQRRARVDVA